MMSKETIRAEAIWLRERFRACWQMKLVLLVGLTVVFAGPYVYLAHHAFFPVHRLPVWPPDRWSGFNRGWVWVYQSLYVMVAILPGLATTRRQLWRYAAGFGLLAGWSFLIFLFFPTQAPRPSDPGAGGMYGLLMSYDGPFNAFPSLHGGFLYLNLVFARRVCRPPKWVSFFFLVWAALILWATLATKEHYCVDLLAGIAMAAVCDAIVWRKRSPGRSTGRDDCSHGEIARRRELMAFGA